MRFPDKCPNCEASTRAYQERIDVRVYSCGTCDDRRKIKDATEVIRAFLDGDRDAREKGQDWIAETAP